MTSVKHFLLGLLLALAALSMADAQSQPRFSGAPRNVGTISSAQQNKAQYILLKGGVPLISVSTGTMGNNGAVTIGTALPATYPNAYLFLPAGAVASGVPASATFLYATCSSTTACTVFNNAFTTGVPTIPASPTAFATTGPGAYTGDTGEEFGSSVSIPANAMGAKGAIQISVAYGVNNTAGAKTARVRFSGNAGTIFFSDALASVAAGGYVGQIFNTATNAQTSENFATISGQSLLAGINGTVDTTAATTLVFSLQKATATDNIVMYPPIVILNSDGT